MRRLLDHLAKPFCVGLARRHDSRLNSCFPDWPLDISASAMHVLTPQARRRRSPVAYFHGCAANYFADGVGDAVIAVLRKHGVEPDLPPQRCSGTPIETYGHRELAKEGARVNLRPWRAMTTS